MGQAAAKSAAVADRIMRDVLDHVGEQCAEGAFAHWLMESGMAHAGADDEFAVLDPDALECRDAIDIDEMPGFGEPEGHGRDQTLAAGEYAAVLRRDLGQDGDCLV